MSLAYPASSRESSTISLSSTPIGFGAYLQASSSTTIVFKFFPLRNLSSLARLSSLKRLRSTAAFTESFSSTSYASAAAIAAASSIPGTGCDDMSRIRSGAGVLAGRSNTAVISFQRLCRVPPTGLVAWKRLWIALKIRRTSWNLFDAARMSSIASRSRSWRVSSA